MDNKVSSNPVERLMENYSKINHDEKFNEEYEYDGIYMFFSFDLVNSTQFKTKYKNKWPIVFDEFYTNITKAMIEQVNGSVVWKYIGDEVLFYKKIDCKKDLFIHLPTLLKIKTDVMDKINKKVNESRGNLYLKTCVWIASARHIPFDTMNKEEVNEYLESGEIEELADLEEVLRAILAAKNVSYDEFEKIRISKVNKRGAFEKKLLLKRTYTDGE